MPLIKKKTAPKRKMIRRRRLARKPRSTYPVWVNRSLQPIPQRSIVTMKYCEALQLNITGATPGSYQWNLNSIFDPNRTGTGHQPYGHDTFQTLYNRYRVIGCHWAIYAFPNANNANIQIAALPANEAFSTLSVSEVRENPRAKYVVVAAGGDPKVLRGYTSLPSLMGRTKAQYMADDRFQATYGSSPSELGLLNTFVHYIGESGSITNVAIDYNIELKFVVESFDAKNLAQS